MEADPEDVRRRLHQVRRARRRRFCSAASLASTMSHRRFEHDARVRIVRRNSRSSEARTCCDAGSSIDGLVVARRVAGGEQQRVALAQRHVEVTGEREQQLGARAASGRSRRSSGAWATRRLRGEVHLAAPAPAPPLTEQGAGAGRGHGARCSCAHGSRPQRERRRQASRAGRSPKNPATRVSLPSWPNDGDVHAGERHRIRRRRRAPSRSGRCRDARRCRSCAGTCARRTWFCTVSNISLMAVWPAASSGGSKRWPSVAHTSSISAVRRVVLVAVVGAGGHVEAGTVVEDVEQQRPFFLPHAHVRF